MNVQLLEEQIQVTEKYTNMHKHRNYTQSEKSLYVHHTEHIRKSGSAWYNELKSKEEWEVSSYAVYEKVNYCYCFIK